MFLFLTDAWSGPQNVMLDLETWGTAPGSAIRSIGAIMFDPHSDELGANFYANLEDDSCLDAGLVKDANTITWWSGQSVKAQEMLQDNQRKLHEVGKDFEAWWRKNRAVFVWSQGSNFDGVLWEVAMRKVGLGVPWKFYDTRDTRTVYDVAGFDPRSLKRKGTAHNALDDARHQALCVQKCYAMLGRT